MAFKWKDEYNVGIAEIDKQHQKLFEIGARIYDLALLDDGIDHYDEIVGILEELKEYAQYHFQYEEKLMDQHAYDAFETHKMEHYFFTKKLQRTNLDEIDDAQDEAISNLLNFVADWITSHILNTDRQYVGLFKEKGIN